MSTTQILSVFATMCGGLALFLYGMSIMSSGLEKLAGGKLQSALKKLTKNKLLGFLSGLGVTVVIQSSSAVMVMLVGLVNSSIIDFSSSVGVIMGSNVGTTVTSWLLSLNGINGESFLLMLLKPIIFSPILALIGVGIRMFSKNESKRDIGTILVGFAVLIIGMDMMSESVSFVKDSQAFVNMLTMFTNPLIALLVAIVFTSIIQSSSATIGIIQALALTGQISVGVAIPLILGANIGTCVTGMFASIGSNSNARKVSVYQIYFNIIGTIIFLPVVLFLGKYESMPATVVTIALIHTVFNVLTSVVFIVFSKLVEKLTEKSVRADNRKSDEIYINEQLLSTPPVAVLHCKSLLCDLSEISKTSVLNSMSLLTSFDKQASQTIFDYEKLSDDYEDKLGAFMVKLGGYDLGVSDSRELGRLLHTIGDFERICDHSTNLVELAQEIEQKNIEFTPEALNELKVITSAVNEIMEITVSTFKNDNSELAKDVEPLEQTVDILCTTARQNHIDRLKDGMCTVTSGFVFSDIIQNLERVSDHCSNIAIFTVRKNFENVDAHSIKYDKTDAYRQKYDAFCKKYSF